MPIAFAGDSGSVSVVWDFLQDLHFMVIVREVMSAEK